MLIEWKSILIIIIVITGCEHFHFIFYNIVRDFTVEERVKKA